MSFTINCACPMAMPPETPMPWMVKLIDQDRAFRNED
jgi:hypothetical protein